MTGEVNTFGWDVVSAIPAKAANKAIANAGTGPNTFSLTPGQTNGHDAQFEGRFKSWRIVGGEGAIIHLEAEIESGHFRGPLSDKLFDLAGAKLGVETFMVIEDHPEIETQSICRLRNSSPHSATQSASVRHIVAGAEELGTIAKSTAEALFEIWVADHLEGFDHIFATIDVTSKVSSGSFAWMKNMQTEFACLGHEDRDGAMIAVLGKAAGSEMPTVQLSPNAIPTGSQSAVLIEPNRVMADLVLPRLPEIFPGTKLDDFELTNSRDFVKIRAKKALSFKTPEPDRSLIEELMRKDGKLTYRDIIDVFHGNDWVATLDKFTLTFRGDRIETNMASSLEISPGIVAHCEHVSEQSFRLGAKSATGGQTIEAYDVKDPFNNPFVTETGVVKAFEIIGLVAAAGIAILVTALSGGATAPGIAAIVAGAVAGGVATALALTPEFFALVGLNFAPKADLMTINVLAPIIWAGAGVFELNQVQLSRSLQFGGTLLASPD